MTKFVITPDVALHLARSETPIPPEHQLLAPTLLRSQTLSLLYRAVRQGELSMQDARSQLSRVRALKIRLLGDRVLQDVAWQLADQLDLPGTLDAEYLALTRLQADALVALSPQLARLARAVVPTAPLESLYSLSPEITPPEAHR
jgi:predicted nucleic acid-binding protein